MALKKHTLDVNIKLINKDCKPVYTTDGSAAMDCKANIAEPVTIEPMKRAIIPLGFAVNLERNFFMDLRPRSGLAWKNGITLANCVGTIDSDFLDEVCAIVINLGDEPFTVNPLDRICQCIVRTFKPVKFNEVNEFDAPDEPPHAGFGSTGIKGENN